MIHAHPTTAPVRPRSWTTDRRVRRILASFRTTPPPVERIPAHERWDREDTRYTGFRIQALGILKAAHQTPRFKTAQAAGDVALCERIAAEPSVGEAIDAALRVSPSVSLAPVTWLGAGRVAA